MVNLSSGISFDISAADNQWENTSRVRDYDDNASFQQIWYRDLVDKVSSQGMLNGQVLDVGCSSGIFVQEQAAQYPDVVFDAIDFSSEMIKQAKNNYADQQNLKFFQGDAQNLKAITGLHDQYNVILAATMLHWVPDQQAALGSMYDKLAPGAKLFVRTFDQAQGTHFLDPSIVALDQVLPEVKSPFALLSMADYMLMANTLNFDRMRFEPATVEMALPSDASAAKTTIAKWLNSWYSPPAHLDSEKIIAQVSDAILAQTTQTQGKRLLPFHFVDLVIEKFPEVSSPTPIKNTVKV